MRVPSDRGPASAQSAPRSGDGPAEAKSFDKVLESKTEEKKSRGDGPKGRRPAIEHEGPQGLASGLLATLPFPDLGPATVAKAGFTPEVRQLDGLVQEILVVAGPGVAPQVEVQFQSTTLEGLNVQIVRKGDEVSIRFLTGSDAVAKLLTRNVDQLSQSLHAKGVPVGPIQVELAPAPARSADAQHDPRGGRRERGDQRQDKRQK
jgi:hypothetical protein